LFVDNGIGRASWFRKKIETSYTVDCCDVSHTLTRRSHIVIIEVDLSFLERLYQHPKFGNDRRWKRQPSTNRNSVKANVIVFQSISWG
jgi:hypothetical protein